MATIKMRIKRLAKPPKLTTKKIEMSHKIKRTETAICSICGKNLITYPTMSRISK